jgi:hypothetical protein
MVPFISTFNIPFNKLASASSATAATAGQALFCGSIFIKYPQTISLGSAQADLF